MTDCTIFLHCNVSGWEYHRDISHGNASADGRLISLSGEVEHRDFIKIMPFDFRLVSGLRPSSISELSDTNILEINEAIPEYEFPESLSALIPIDETQLEELRDCLLQSANNPTLTLSVTLTVEGLKKDREVSDHIVLSEGQEMMITGFAWNLSYKNDRKVCA